MSGSEKNQIVSSKSGAQALPADAYWTPERRAAAKPVPPPKPGPGEKKAQAAEKAQAEGGVEPGHTSSGKPRSAKPGAEPKAAPDAAGGNPVSDPKVYPYSTCGKLFFSQDGHDYAGSAAVVSRNVILTAGHCVHKGGGGSWSSNVAFYPSYPLIPLHFSYNFLAAWTAFTNNGNRAFDYGMIWVDNNPGDPLGWLGLLWNASTSNRTWDAVGYPATPSPPFDGNRMDEARGTFASSTTAGIIGLNNDNMEHGSSGGPWITDFNGAAEYANGLQSFHNHDGDFVEYGPYFTADVKRLFDWISDPANRH
jgi:V8-like Glu-specific endopeptidase